MEKLSTLKIVQYHVGHRTSAQLGRHAFLSHRVKPHRRIIPLNHSFVELHLRRHPCHVLMHVHQAATLIAPRANFASRELLVMSVDHITAEQV